MFARTLGGALFAVAVAGCGGGASASSDMIAAPLCAAMSMGLAAYTGDSAGAYATALPIVRGFQSDAELQEIDGSFIGVSGRSAQGTNGGQWVVDFYSPTTRLLYRGVFSSDLSHVSCQTDLKATNGQTFAAPTQTSVDVVRQAWMALGVKSPDPQKIRVGVTYGLVSQGSQAPRPLAWKVDDGSGDVVILLDAGLTAVECYLNGAAIACH